MADSTARVRGDDAYVCDRRSTLVEIHRDMNLRAQGMQLMLESLYSQVALPKLSKAGGNDVRLHRTVEISIS